MSRWGKRRRWLRVPAHYEAELHVEGKTFRVIVEDISPQGARLRGAGPWSQNLEAVLQVSVDGRELSSHVAFRWVEGGADAQAGIEFLPASAQDRGDFRALVWRALELAPDRSEALIAALEVTRGLQGLAEQLQTTPTILTPTVLELLAEEAESLARLARVASAHQQPRPEPLPVDATRPRARVVLIDDDEISLLALAELLGEEFTVITATDAISGLEAIRRAPLADAVVTDLEMPGLRGNDVLRLLRADPATAEIPCLVLTAAAGTGDKREAFQLGAADYVLKPVDVPELVARLRHRIDEAERLRNERALHEVDPLSGLANRRALVRGLAAAIRHARHRSRPLALVLADADGLKRINDTHGHPVGDLAIRAIAEALRRQKRDADLPVRLGGDEFALVLPDTDAGGAERVCARLVADLAAHPLRVAGQDVPVTVSHGAAVLEAGDDEHGEQLMARADLALYACKAAHGRRGT